MGKRKKRSHPISQRPQKSPIKEGYLLDRFTSDDIRRWNEHSTELRQYYWEYYSILAGQRANIFEELKKSLASNVKPLKIEKWCRAVSFPYSDNPLSGRGSILNETGGRFNIGSIDETRFPIFPAVYIAEDFETAYREKFHAAQGQDHHGLTTEDLSLSQGPLLILKYLDKSAMRLELRQFSIKPQKMEKIASLFT